MIKTKLSIYAQQKSFRAEITDYRLKLFWQGLKIMEGTYMWSKQWISVYQLLCINLLEKWNMHFTEETQKANKHIVDVLQFVY